MKIDYSRYQTLSITRRGVNDAVLDIQMRASNGKLPTAGHEGHSELAEIWRDVGADDTVRCAVLRGEGLGFSGGGDLGLVEDMRVRWRIDERWTAAFGIDNLNNYTYWNFHPYPQRSYSAELKVDL